MGVTISYDPSSDLTILKAEGVSGYEDFKQAVEHFYKSGDFNLSGPVLCDLRRVVVGMFTSEEIHKLAEMVVQFEKYRGSGKTAIVAQQDIVFGLARMFEQFTGSRSDTIRVFREVQQAHLWLASQD
jgi:hypothetical protein